MFKIIKSRTLSIVSLHKNAVIRGVKQVMLDGHRLKAMQGNSRTEDRENVTSALFKPLISIVKNINIL